MTSSPPRPSPLRIFVFLRRKTRPPVKKLITIATFVITALTSPAVSPAELNTTADAYLAVYTAQDLPALAKFYTAESVFNDPTAAGIWGESFTVTGGENIITAMREGWSLIRSFTFEVRERITFHDRVIFVGTSHMTLDGALFGGTPGQSYDFEFSAVTILQISHGKIVQHLDHYDYSPLRDA